MALFEFLFIAWMENIATLPCAFVGFQGVRSKNKLILRLMEQLVYPNPAGYRDTLIRFSALNHTNYSEVGSSTEFLYSSINVLLFCVLLVPFNFHHCLSLLLSIAFRVLLSRIIFTAGAEGKSTARTDQTE